MGGALFYKTDIRKTIEKKTTQMIFLFLLFTFPLTYDH